MVEQHPVVTIYITNYNYGRYLEQAIQSVLGQTFENFELIIIDDGSTDDSQQIMNAFEHLDNVFIVLQQNWGLNATNNTALRLARGKYIIRLDADDFLDSHALEVLVTELERHPDLALIFPDYYIVNEQGDVLEQVRRHNFVNDVTLPDQPAHGACTMIRRDILRAVGGYDEAFTRQDGYDLWLKIIDRYPVKNVNLPLFYYRQHGGNLTKDESKLLSTRAEMKAKHVQKRGLNPLTVVGVIPVRGSVADPRSFPLKYLGQKPLIDWTIDAALESKYIDPIVVTTPDEKVQAHVRKKYGKDIVIVPRKAELARINTRIEDTIMDAINFIDIPMDALAILYTEAPFRSGIYIDKAINTMQLYGVDVVDAVRLDDSLFYYHDGHGLQLWKNHGGLRLERDDLYRRVGGLHIIKLDFFERERTMLKGKIGHIRLDQKAAFMIKSEFDWQIAKLLAEKGE